MPADSKLEILFELNSKLDGINTAINRVDRLNKRSSLLSQSLGGAQRALGTLARAGAVAGAALSASAVIGGTIFARDSLNKFAQFEASMKGVEAVLKPTTAQLAALEKEAKRLGRTTKFSAREASAGIEILAKNGVTTEKILGGVLENSLLLSASVGAALPEAADTLTDALAIFNLEADRSRDVIDSINSVTINSKFAFEDYQSALANGGSSAVAAGQSIEDFNTAISASASFFANGEQAGTSYKAFIKSFTKDSTKAEAAKKQLNLTFEDGNGGFKDLADIAGQLKTAFDELDPAERAKAFNDLFDQRGKNFAIALARTGEEGIRSARFLSQFADASEQAEKRLEGTQGAITRFKSAFEGLQIAVGGGIAESGLPFLDALTGKMSGLALSADGSQDAITELFNSIILGAARASDAVGEVKAVILGWAAAGAAAIGNEDLQAALGEEIINAQDNSAEDAANQIIENAAKAKSLRAQIADDERAFLNASETLRVAAQNKSAAAEIEAIENSITAISDKLKEKKAALESLRTGEGAPEADQSARLVSSIDAQVSIMRDLAIEKKKLTILENEEQAAVIGSADARERANKVYDQRDFVNAKQRDLEAARDASQGIEEADRDIIDSTGKTIDEIAEMARSAGVSVDQMVSHFRHLGTEAPKQLAPLHQELDNVKTKMAETARAINSVFDVAGGGSGIASIARSLLSRSEQIELSGQKDRDKILSDTEITETLREELLLKLQTQTAEKLEAAKQQGTSTTSSPAAAPRSSAASGNGAFESLERGLMSDSEDQLLMLEQDRALVLEQEQLTQDEKHALIEQLEEQHQGRLAEIKEQEKQRERATAQAKLDQAANFFGNLASLTRSSNKKLFAIGKAAAIAEATISGLQAVQNALAVKLTPPIPQMLAVAAGVAAAVNVAKISAQQAPAFFAGGVVGGEGARPAQRDNRLIKAADGEFIVNNRDSRANLSLLKEINSGGDPTKFLDLPAPSATASLASQPEITVQPPASQQGAQETTVNMLFDNDAFMDKMEERIGQVALNAFHENSSQFIE